MRPGRRERGGIGVQLLGTVLVLLLLVGGLGLAEGARAKAVRTAYYRGLAAAVQSAALAEPARREAVFRQVLGANLGPGARAGASVKSHGFWVTGVLKFDHRLEYLGRWLPPIPVRLEHTEPVRRRS